MLKLLKRHWVLISNVIIFYIGVIFLINTITYRNYNKFVFKNINVIITTKGLDTFEDLMLSKPTSVLILLFVPRFHDYDWSYNPEIYKEIKYVVRNRS